MLNGYRIIDVDSHAMEPDDLWDRFLDRKYAAFAPRSRRISTEYPGFATIDVLGHRFPEGAPLDVDDATVEAWKRGGPPAMFKPYWKYVERGFSAESYLEYMDEVGIDHLFIYPTIALISTGVPNMEPKLAAALKRAYNDWLYEFCLKGDGRLHGVAALDLRDADLAIAEAERCVRELGYRSVYIMPDIPVEGIPLDHPYYDELWAAVASLGVPLGTHMVIHHKTGNVGYVANKHVTGSSIPYAVNAVSFRRGEMVAALMCTGAICERPPDLKVVFTESSVGWAATWLEFLDQKWNPNYSLAEHPPSYYFKRQCFISGEAGERGYSYAVQAGLEDNLMAASDFPHPEDDDFPKIMDKFFDGEHVQLDDSVLRKLLWDTPARLYGLS